MNIENAMKIEGWMNEPELIWLAEQASLHTRIVEIGCWMGRSTRVLADNTPGMVMAVDTWEGSEEHKGDFVGKHPDWVYSAFLSNMNGLKNVFPVRRDSVVASAVFRASGLKDFDMVFIDASHDYESIRADIKSWLPLICSGGLICGHDHGHPPIERAVSELLPGAGSTVGIWHMVR